MKIILNDNYCCGCSSCYNACPKKCISMNFDENYNLIPYIDETLCIECGTCTKKCFKNSKINFQNVMKAYAGTRKEKDILLSSSGGAFYALAKYCLDKKGIVVGCTFDENMMPLHKIIFKIEDLSLLQNSKYVQSNINNIYQEIVLYLKKGNFVLFSGTPCQIAGLYSFLNRPYENLITCDLICHGVSNYKIWLDYVSFLENKYNKKIVNMVFRSKKKYWGNLIMEITFKDKTKKYLKSIDSSYYYYYLKGYIYRDSCYSCEFSRKERIGDFTIGDYWGVELENPELFNKKGVSLITVNNEKALNIIADLKQYIDLNEIEYEKAIKHNKALREPVKKPLLNYINIWNNEGYVGIENKYLEEKKQLKKLLRKNKLKRIIKGILLKINILLKKRKVK